MRPSENVQFWERFCFKRFSITREQREGQPEGGLRLVRWTRRRVRRAAGRLAWHSAGRPGGARVVSGAEKSFDRGGPVWPPRSNVTNDRLKGDPGGDLSPTAKNRGVWQAAPPSQNRKIFEKFPKKSILAGRRCPRDPPVFGRGAKAPQTTPLKRSFVTFDRGGQTRPPRSNDFFSAPLTTRAPPGRPAEHPPDAR